MKRGTKAAAIVLGATFLIARPSSAGAEEKTPAARDPCARLSEIRTIPLQDERVDDEAYYAVMAVGAKAIPCLIQSLTDTRPTPDPRRWMWRDSVAVGDVAAMLLFSLPFGGRSIPLPPRRNTTPQWQ